MATDSIVEKINKITARGMALNNEPEALYFLVQLRKPMERENILNDQ